MQNIQNLSIINFSDWSAENLATLLVGLAFGWNLTAQPWEDPTEIEGPPEPIVDEPDPLDALHFREVVTEDYEVERWILIEKGGCFIDEHGLPQWKPNQYIKNTDLADDIGNCFGTRSGDNPVIWDLPTQASLARTACGFLPEEICDLPDQDIPEYFTWKYSAQGAKRREHNFHRWVRWIANHKDKPATLEVGRKKFWTKYFKRSAAGTVANWLTAKHITLIKNYFERVKMEG